MQVSFLFKHSKIVDQFITPWSFVPSTKMLKKLVGFSVEIEFDAQEALRESD